MKQQLTLLLSLATIALSGCLTHQPNQPPTTASWQAQEVSSQDGYSVPECVVADDRGNIFVSNIAPVDGVYWDDDGSGFISKLNAEGKLGTLV